MGLCYSRWFFNKDLTLIIKKVTSNGVFNSYFPEKAIDGVFTYGAIFIGGGTHSWILFELEKVHLVKAILIIPRDKISRFKNVLLEVGKTESTLKKFDQYGPTEAVGFQVIEFQGLYGPMKGKFIKLTTGGSNLIIAEAAILGA